MTSTPDAVGSTERSSDVACFYSWSILRSSGYVMVVSTLSSVVLAAMMRILQAYNVPASTSSFVLTRWIFMVAVYSFDSFSRGAILPTPLFHWK
jgi:urea transporter